MSNFSGRLLVSHRIERFVLLFAWGRDGKGRGAIPYVIFFMLPALPCPLRGLSRLSVGQVLVIP